MKNKWSHIEIVLGVIAISFSPLVVKLVSFTPSVSAFYRSLYSAIFLFAFALVKWKTEFNFRNTRWLMPSILAGVFLGVDLIIWHKTIIYLGAGPATFLGNSQIIFMTLFAALVFKEKIPLAYYAVVAVVMSGLYMLIPMSVSVISRPVGYLMGLVVGFTYAGMLICLRYAKSFTKDDYPEILSLVVVFIVSALLIALYIFGIEQHSMILWDAKSHLYMALAALMCQSIGWYLINSSITKVPAHEGSLLLMIQPVLAMIWGSLFFAEPLGIIQIYGIALTLTGISVYQWKYTKRVID